MSVSMSSGEFRIADGAMAFEVNPGVGIDASPALICNWSAYNGWVGEFPCGVIYKVFVPRKSYSNKSIRNANDATNEYDLKWQFRRTIIRQYGLDIDLSRIWIIWE